jgi:hypothetical protein
VESISRYVSIAWERRLSTDLMAELSAGSSEPAALAAALRQEGLPVQSYRMADRAHVATLQFPFLTMVNRQWVVGVPRDGEATELASEVGSLSLDSLPPDPVLVAEPPIGAAFTLQENSASNTPAGPDGIALFYTPTNGDAGLAEEQLLDDLEHLIVEARGDGKDVVFIDSVGLVPAETVRMLGGDRRAFLTALGGLRSELARAKSGTPARDLQHPIWDSAYRVLHNHGVDAVLENLKFDLWMRSVSFDQTRLAQRALAHFTAHQLEVAAKHMAAYRKEFHRINCTERNGNLVRQIEELTDQTEHPALILVIREIGHFGVLDRLLAAKGFAVRSKILGRERFPDLLKVFGMGRVLENMGVASTSEEQRVMALRECLKHLVFQRVMRDVRMPELMQHLPDFKIDRLGWERIDDLIDRLHDPSRVYLRNHPHNFAISDQLLYLLKTERIVPETWIPDAAEEIPIGGEHHGASTKG